MSDLPSIREAFLEAIETADSEREMMLSRLAPAVRTEVVSLLAAYDSAGDFLRPLDTAHDAPADSTVGPYRLLDKAGQGGMGVVYRATRADGEFEREVAIKFVGGRLFAPEAERRFLAERRILALLDHPNIVHMIDGGVWQGRRYLVMEWVSGKTVTQYCRDAKLSIPERLRVFRTICAAIQYAHQHLILHRDIKPANILVTPAGDVKVLDFGIARLLADDDRVTAETTMLHPMSLSCASPEQLRGEPLTLSSDIYALGLLLYELLTGTNPQATGASLEIQRRIEEGAIVAPSKLDSKISKDLDAIVLKAVSRDPTRRYGSAAEMSADVGRFLDSRPVLARAPSRLYLATRFMSRNRALTATALALILAILCGSAGALWEAHRAEQNRQLAERRFAEARRLVYTVIHELQPQMAGINGTIKLRVQLIEKTLGYLEALRLDASDNPTLMGELIDGYVELAGVSGAAGQANVGDPKHADELLKKARALAERLNRAGPLSPQSLSILSKLYRASARQQGLYGKRDMAVQFARRAVESSTRLAAERPTDPAAQQDVAHSVTALADVSPDEDEKVRLYLKAAGIWSAALDKQAPAEAGATRSRIAVIQRNLSTAWYDKHDYARAIESGTKARELDEAGLAANPSSPAAQLAVAFDLGTLGSAFAEMGQDASAAENWRRSVALREKVLAGNLQDYRAADRLAYALHELARIEKRMAQPAPARTHFRHAIDLYEGLSRAGALHKQSLFKYASSCHLLGLLEHSCALQRRAAELAVLYEKESPTADRDATAKIKWDAAICAN